MTDRDDGLNRNAQVHVTSNIGHVPQDVKQWSKKEIDKWWWWGHEHMNKGRSYRCKHLPNNKHEQEQELIWEDLTNMYTCLVTWILSYGDGCDINIHLFLPSITINVLVVPVRPYLGYIVPIVTLQLLVNRKSRIIVSVWGRHLAQFYIVLHPATPIAIQNVTL